MAYQSGHTIVGTQVHPAPRVGAYRTLLKRGFDITLVLLMAFPALVILSVLSVIVALDGKSPFYWQERVGRHGKTYRMLKLRSMVPNADALLEAHLEANPEARREWDEMQKLKADPRITRIGRIIRKTSMDELPQLWNVLKGEMSVVGPRPMMTDQVSLYPGTAYYAMAPGITGYWQVSDRNECSFAERAYFDNRYFTDLSFATDITVLALTVKVVLRCTGH